MCFSEILYAAQTDEDGSGSSEFANIVNTTDLVPGEYEGYISFLLQTFLRQYHLIFLNCRRI